MKCIICGHQQQPAFKKHNFQIIKCFNCGLFRTQLDTNSRRSLHSYYDKNYFRGGNDRAGYANYQKDEHIVLANSNGYLDQICLYQQGGNLLDIGCATGIFMQAAEARGFTGYGIDVSNYAINIASKKFFSRVKLGQLGSARLPHHYFDVITLFDVFEHLANPGQNLQICRQLLKKNGILVINTGDSNSLLAKLEGKGWHYFIPPQHLFFYSKANLLKLLDNYHFRAIYTNSSGKYLSLRYLLHLSQTINKSAVSTWLFNLTRHRAIGKLPLYLNFHDNMTIIAK